MARLAQPNGPYWTAFTLSSDIAVHGLSIRLEEAHEFLFGADVDRLCAERHLMLDVATASLAAA